MKTPFKLEKPVGSSAKPTGKGSSPVTRVGPRRPETGTTHTPPPGRQPAHAAPSPLPAPRHTAKRPRGAPRSAPLPPHTPCVRHFGAPRLTPQRQRAGPPCSAPPRAPTCRAEREGGKGARQETEREGRRAARLARPGPAPGRPAGGASAASPHVRPARRLARAVGAPSDSKNRAK